MSVLRFVTAGSVDDGKSTLIGRLLLDTQAVFEDQLLAVEKASLKRGMDAADLSLFTDGLQAEREQGITIDVAYRYFATSKRKFIVTDCPGHQQYTRNMVTGASNAQLAILLIDATKGLTEQTKKHARICAWLGIKQLVIAINKIDLVDFSKTTFEVIKHEFQQWSAGLSFKSITAIPVSAVLGDMVAHRGEHLSWYEGPTLLETLEAAPDAEDQSEEPLGDHVKSSNQLDSLLSKSNHSNGDTVTLFDVQRVIRANGQRYYAGRVDSGKLKVGQTLTALPSGEPVKVSAISVGLAGYSQATRGRSLTLQLDREIDLGRGDVLTSAPKAQVTDAASADIAWFAQEPLQVGRPVIIKNGTRRLKARVEHIESESLPTDAIGNIRLQFSRTIAFPSSRKRAAHTRFIMIDPITAATLGAGFLNATTSN
jgi:sulfate adenylyltransferase subunit 1